jgi:hypothetical protein
MDAIKEVRGVRRACIKEAVLSRRRRWQLRGPEEILAGLESWRSDESEGTIKLFDFESPLAFEANIL